MERISCELHLNARTPASRIPGVFQWTAFRLDLGEADTAFHFENLIAEKRGALEFEIRRSLLHFFLELAQQLSEIEIAADLADDRRLNFATTR